MHVSSAMMLLGALVTTTTTNMVHAQDDETVATGDIVDNTNTAVDVEAVADN